MARDRTQELAAGGPYSGFKYALLATIPNGQALSEVVDLGPLRLGAIAFPPAWTAASLTFSVGYDGANVTDLLDATGTEYSITVTAGKVQIVTIPDFLTFNTIRLRSGPSAAAVNQGADRLFGLLLVP